MTTLTIAGAYRAGNRARPAEFDTALERFIARYCDHAPSSACDLCTAYWNGYDDQAMPDRKSHAKACPRGLADRGNHEDCQW